MKIGVYYVSMSGKTEAIADIIAEELKKQDHEVVFSDLVHIQNSSELLNYDLTFIGMYTWGDGDYPDEVIDIMEELEQLELNQQPFAIYGSGDTSYPEFCGALDKLQQLLEGQGGNVIGELLKIEFDPQPEDQSEIKKFVSNVLEKF